MGKRKERPQKMKNSVVSEEEKEEARFDDEEIEEQGEEGSKFFGCYLLTSLCPRFKGHTYIGFTVNPGRRIRQHNGEIRMGAWRTKRKRPWEMVLCIYGFPTNVSALQFEWAWQHPVESRAVRQAAASFKSFGGVANKIKMAYTMLTLPAWESLNLTVNFFSTKYKKHSAGCPSLPQHMKVQVCALDELPCYTGIDVNDCTNDDWGNSEEFDGSSEKLTEEGSLESTVSNSSAGNRYNTEENVHEHFDWREESIDEQAEENSTTNKEDRKELHLLYKSPVKASYSILSGSYDKVDNFEDNVHEHIDWREESIDQQTEENTTNTKECHLLNDSPVKASFSIQSGSYDTLDNFEDIWDLDKEVGGKPRRPTNKRRSTKVVADQDPSPSKREGSSSEVEVIDLFTPPCFKANPDSKRRRPSNACPHIIDLTESPIFV